MYQKTITLFNYHAKTDSWYTTVFVGTDLIENTGTNATRQGQTNSDAVDLLIHVRKDKTADTIYSNPALHLDKQYVGSKTYAAIENPRNYFTFTPESDFFIVGSYYSAEPVADAEFEDGLYSAMNAAHDGVYMVSSVAFYSLIPHFEIGGR